MPVKIAFIGAGRMASAIIRGLLAKNHYAPSEIACTCGKSTSGPDLAADTGILYFPDIRDAVAQAGTLVLACKPYQLEKLDPALVEAAEGSLILSVLAGTTLASLSAKFPNARNVVRTMPNTPGQIGVGATGYSPLKALSESDLEIVESALSSLGTYHAVNEADLDALTAISGSGPAYVFEFAAALREAGVNAGLDSDLANKLAIQTLLGASMLMDQSDQTPEELRDAVTSPGGTTAAALNSMSDQNFRNLINVAIQAAKARSIEIGKS